MDQSVWQAKGRDLRGQIMAVLHEEGEIDAAVIVTATGKRDSEVRGLLKKMVQDGDVSCRKDPDTPQKMLYSIGTSSGQVLNVQKHCFFTCETPHVENLSRLSVYRAG